jgi:ferrous iron transport protein B
MGLTHTSTGAGAAQTELTIVRERDDDRVVALAGNPNVGKSTVFNALTGLHQHTGNWPGKTVTCAQGRAVHGGQGYIFVDLPGTYSLLAHSQEEAAARDFLHSGQAQCVVVVCDAACLERNLILALQVLELTGRAVLCVNLLDEAAKREIQVDQAALSRSLGTPVVGTAAAQGQGLDALMDAVAQVCAQPEREPLPPMDEEARVARAEQIARACVHCPRPDSDRRDRRLDRVLTSRRTGIPIMLALLAGVLWLTIAGANAPSELLSRGLFWLQDRLSDLFTYLNAPAWLHGALVLGVYRVLAWVVSAMLPPMAIFFPLFTLLEDFGYLPRVAFVLDHTFQKCRACGKQCLSMCMGLGCNAAGVVGCRIIDSPRERLIAILTNSFVPCNGRFPTLIALITMFFVGVGGGLGRSLWAAALLTGVIALGVLMTFAVSRLLSATVLKGTASSFTLELPPYRRPRIGQVIVRSVLDRTLFVLGRAATVAAPAGLVIYLCANLQVGDASVLARCVGFLDPFARLFGLDGAILMAFVLGAPASEIVLPILLMTYLSTGTIGQLGDLGALHTLLVEHGWTWVTAVCTMLFSLFHWPCATTCVTIWRETKSARWTALGVAIPTAVGLLLCLCVATAARLGGILS